MSAQDSPRSASGKWLLIATNALMWLPAFFIVGMQFASLDTVATRILAILALLAVLAVWSVGGLCSVPVKKTWLHASGATLVLLSVLLFNLPLRLMFAPVRSKMDGLADQVEHGRTIGTPFHVGSILVQKAEAWNDMQCFWTGSAVVGDHIGYCRLKTGDPAQRINEWSIVDLGGGWYHIVED